MCIIAVKYQGIALPKDEFLRNCERTNKDGIGVGLWKDGSHEVIIKKDFLNANDLIPWLKDNVAQNDCCVIHFRYATHGLKDIGNRHPFPITKNKELLRKPELVCQSAVAHNGVISNYGHHDKFSDTQKFILDILSEEEVKNHLDSPGIQKLINNFISGDRLAILDAQGTCYRYGEWEENEGIFYSNFGFRNYYETNRGCNNSYVSDYTSDVDTDTDKEEKRLVIIDKDTKIKVDKETEYTDKCDGCCEVKLLRQVIAGELEMFLCADCRKKLKKGKLEITNELGIIETTKPEMKCDSCSEWIPEAELEEFGDEMICKSCAATFVKYSYGQKTPAVEKSDILED